MHPWIQNLIYVCAGKIKEDYKILDEDSLGKWFSLEKHAFGEFSMANVQANDEMEDQSQVEVASNNALFVGVYDGHGGVHASTYIVQHLFRNLLRFAHENDNTITQDTLRNAVYATENGFLNYVQTNYIVTPELVEAGSCCLAGVIWKKKLYVANLGDSRAIIVSMVNGVQVVEQLTTDHNCNNVVIREQLKSQYLFEPNIVVEDNGRWRLRGMIEVTRTIGDAHLKNPDYSYRDMFPVKRTGRKCRDKSVLSAEPEMRSRDLGVNDKFLIFASYGLWNLLSNEQAAEIVQTNPRKGIAKRLLSVALSETARIRGTAYKNIQAATRAPDIMSRRGFHDDISVIVVFLDRTSFLRIQPLNKSYIGSNPTSLPSDFAPSGLITLTPSPLSPRRLKESLKRRLKLKSSSPLTARTP